MESYTYEELPDANSIRLLTVEPFGSKTDDIRGSLRIVRMGREFEYTALSYSWAMDDGDASINRSITVDGKTLGVTRNLYEGLQRIFVGAQPQRPIWADAICIDQGNDQERSEQVPRMGQIFSNAEEVICWLGNGCSTLDTANIATLMECFSQPRHSTWREHKLVNHNGSALDACLVGAAFKAHNAIVKAGERYDGRAATIIRDLFDIVELELTVVAVCRILSAFYTRRYWSRRWIVQEVAHAQRRVSVQLAGCRLDLQQVEAGTAFLTTVSPKSSIASLFAFDWSLDDEKDNIALSLAYLRAASIFHMRDEYSSSATKGISLKMSLLFCYGFVCLDPRDIVFSLLSLDTKTRIRADYSMTLAEVFTTVTIDLLRRLRTLEDSYTRLPGILACAASMRSVQSHDDETARALPSWVLDLRDWTYLGSGPAIDAWDILPGNAISCSALIVGTLSEDLETVECSISDPGPFVVNPCAQKTQRYPILSKADRFDKRLCCPGDLVCIFDDTDRSLDPPRDSFAIVMHPVEGIEDGYRIVNCLYFEATHWVQ